LEEDGVVGSCGVGLEKEFEGGFGVEAGLGGEGGAKEGRGVGSGG
jgi:hypothetical protein